jgi:subtilisin-like proprotein convertase family protein
MLVFAALALPGSALALGPPARQPFIIDTRHQEATMLRGNQRVNLETGVPRALYDVDYSVAVGDPEIMARQYLREHVEILRLGDPGLADLALRATRQGPAGITVRFEQRFQGLPVLAPDVAVTIDRSNRVTFVMNGYEPGVSVPSITPTVSEPTARATAHAWIGLQGALNYDVARLVVVPEGKVSRLAWQVRMVPSVSPIGDWEVLVDARTGTVFRAVDRACSATGTGYVFDPDALSAAHALYGAAGFVDGSDVTTPQLDAARSSRTLQDITDLGGGNFELKGPYAEIVDSESPFKGLFTQAGSTFNYDRSQDNFEAVNTYYHIDQIMRHVNVELGIACVPFQYVGGVRFDPSGLAGADNSHYTPSTGQLAFGEGGVDDAEDADVVIHELGHGLHDWLTAGALSQVDGLSEGLGDYNAQSYSRSLGQWASNETHYDWTFDWDGHNPFWPGRITNDAAHYPEGLVGEVHEDGQIWASCLMKIWNDIGRNKTDKAVWQGIAMTNSSSSQNDAAHAVLQAAIALGYTSSEINSFVTHFQATGYDVSVGVDYVSHAVTDECPSNVGNQNGVVEPGEDVTLPVTIKASTFSRTGVTGVLTTSTPGVTILDGTASWPDLAPGVSAATTAPHFKIRLAGSVPCLSTIDFQLSVSTNEGGPFLMTFSRLVGQPALPTGLPVAIPDNTPAGVTNVFNVPDNLTLTDVNVRVKINHTWVGDLFFKLKSPLGTEVTLLDRPGVPTSTYGCSDNDLDVTFDDASGFNPETYCNGTTPWFTGTAKPVGLLSGFNGQSTQGNWTLTVSDNAGADVGSLVAWELLTTPPLVGQCVVCINTAGVPLAAMGGRGLALATGHPTPFSRTTEIEFQLARAGRATLRVYDIAGHLITTLVDGDMEAGPHIARWNGTDQAGQAVASGIYFYRLTSAGAGAIRRTLLVR